MNASIIASKVVSYMDKNLPTTRLNGVDIRGLVCETIAAYPIGNCCGGKIPDYYVMALSHLAFADVIRRNQFSVESLGLFKRTSAEATNTQNATQDEVEAQISYHINRGLSFYHKLVPFATDCHSIM